MISMPRVARMSRLSFRRPRSKSGVNRKQASGAAVPPMGKAAGRAQEVIKAFCATTLQSASLVATLDELAELLDSMEGYDAELLGKQIRASSALGVLVSLLDSSNQYVLQGALFVLANLSSDAYDRSAYLTKAVRNSRVGPTLGKWQPLPTPACVAQRLKKLHAFERVVEHVWSRDAKTLFFVLGVVHPASSPAPLRPTAYTPLGSG